MNGIRYSYLQKQKVLNNAVKTTASYKIEYQRLAAPYSSNCLESNVETLFSKTFPNIKYSQQACFKSCLYYKTFDVCGCYIPKYTFNPETNPVCTIANKTLDNCMHELERLITTGNVTCNCGPACK
ncbi:degenerin del-1-like [Anneissia japonica]|uniref:degenerin del-1-like n=1 Tax=Anneissia japonica TaxID=1529436 RepID=UPI0014258622|nr:degenerin del-1-like [Anneissia japonica]